MNFNALEFAYFDCCYSGKLKINEYNQLVHGRPGQIGLFDELYSDMSFALGIDNPGKSRVYQGWYGNVPIRIWPIETQYQKWTRLEWESLGNGYNLIQAITDTIYEQTDFGPDAPLNNYRLKGHGFLTDIKLNGN